VQSVRILEAVHFLQTHALCDRQEHLLHVSQPLLLHLSLSGLVQPAAEQIEEFEGAIDQGQPLELLAAVRLRFLLYLFYLFGVSA
jgi:hypothetical protein